MNEKHTWFIGDTHFGHRNIIDYCCRPFSSTEEMEEVIVENWNSVVRRDDLVFMVGDFGLCSKKDIIRIGKRLNGRKTLILGNHDGASRQTYLDAGFDYISQYPILFNDFFIVSHYPQNIQEKSMYANIFAHVHTNPEYNTATPVSFCVSAERINYTPISFYEIRKRMSECKS